jgi:hypothetical protein
VRKMIAWFLMVGMALDAGALSAADADPCTRFTWDVSRELAVMQQTPRAVTAAVKPGTEVPQIESERLYEVKLALQNTVTFVAKPGKPTPVNGAYAALVRLRVEKAGRYRLSISSGHWIDIVEGTQLVHSGDFQGQHGCQRPHKIVEFELPAGHDLTVQFSGSPDAQVLVAITAVSKPAAG